METELLVNVEAVNRMLTDLSFKNKKTAVRGALRMAGNIIKKQTVSNLKQSVNVSPALSKGVKVVVFKNLQGVRVHIMGDYRLKWIELGTEDRYTKGVRKYSLRSVFGRKKEYSKKPSFKGRMKPSRFLYRAVMRKEDEAQRSLMDFLIKTVKRVSK